MGEKFNGETGVRQIIKEGEMIVIRRPGKYKGRWLGAGQLFSVTPFPKFPVILILYSPPTLPVPTT